MHKIFGEKIKANYYDRAGAYIICCSNGKFAVAKTPKGFFLLGGGIEQGETQQECIVRECIEEIGYEVVVDEKICSAEHYTYHNRIGYFHPIQTYYSGKLIKKVCTPIENDHFLMWLTYDELQGRMFSPMQNWALDTYWKIINGFDMDKIIYKEEAPSANDYNELRISSGIGKAKEIQNAEIALKNSLYAVSVYYDEKLIGSARIIGDGGVSFAVTDVMVDKYYQNNGIGTAIMQYIDKWLSINTDENAFVMLIANKPADRLYLKNNFEYLPNNKIGMLRNNQTNKLF